MFKVVGDTRKDNMQLNRILKKRIIELERAVERAQKLINVAPSGFIRMRNNKGDEEYSHINVNAGKKSEKYISKRNTKEIKQLVNKKYAVHLMPIIKKELKELKRLEVSYNPSIKYEAIKALPPAMQKYATPIFLSPQDIYERWVAEEYEVNENYPESLIYETRRHEIVRSKGELFIADTLDEYGEMLDYRYEKPTILPDGTRIYTDFEIINKKTGRIRRWEHFGRMSDLEYVDDQIRKFNSYTKAGIMPGRDIIYTYESLTRPLDTRAIRKIVEWLCLDEEYV